VKTHRKIPAATEWKFDAFRDELEGRRLYFCFTYEYARCVPWIVKAIRNERRQGLPYRHKVLARRLPGGVTENSLGLSAKPEDCDLLLTGEGFPQVPFLDAGFEKMPDEEFPNAPETPALQPAISIDERWLGGETYTEVPAEEIYSFAIRWDRSPDAIISAFKKWVHDGHPREQEKGRGTCRERNIRTDLKALGAWRLLRCFKGNIPEARKIVDPVRLDLFYARDEDWLKAQDRAQRIIDDWSERGLFGVV
jgi:hypothetical protein